MQAYLPILLVNDFKLNLLGLLHKLSAMYELSDFLFGLFVCSAGVI